MSLVKSNFRQGRLSRTDACGLIEAASITAVESPEHGARIILREVKVQRVIKVSTKYVDVVLLLVVRILAIGLGATPGAAAATTVSTSIFESKAIFFGADDFSSFASDAPKTIAERHAPKRFVGNFTEMVSVESC